jgi:outer membrane protein assembly factor BamB
MASRYLKTVLCLSLVSAAAATAPLVGAADWLLFRGNPLQSGVAASPLPDKLEILWTFKVKDGIESTAAIAGDTVFVGAYDEHLYALDLATGKPRWAYKAGPIKAPVSVRDGAVYVGDEDGLFHCVDAATGQKRWTFETGSEISSGANFVGDAVLFGSGDENLYCLSKEGKQRWKFKVPGGPVMGSSAVVENRTFVAGCDSSLHVLDVTNGTEVTAVELGGQVGATAAVAGDRLYVGTMSSQVLGVDWKKGQVLWTYEAAGRKQAFYASVALTDRLVIAGSRDKLVHALDRQTGKAAWTFPTRGRVDSSPVVDGRRVFVGSLDGHLYVLDLDRGKELQKLDLGSPISASPAVSGNRLILGTQDGVLYCLGAKK